MKTNWSIIIIGGLLILIGIMVSQMCKRTPETIPAAKVTIDSLKAVNVNLTKEIKAKTDSVDSLIRIKDKRTVEMQKTVNLITEKYNRLRNQTPPEKDTIIKVVEVLDGKECLEKMPIIQAQLGTANSIIADLKNKCVMKDTLNISLQRQFDRSIQLNIQQEDQAKKDKRKAKWQKRGMWAGLIVGAGGIIYAIAK